MFFTDSYYALLCEKSEREDMVMFVNACFAATGQNEYYIDRYTQAVSINFLHQYMLANYRHVYSRMLAAGINHFNQALIIRNLLAAGAPSDSSVRVVEGQLIGKALRNLPANRVFKLFARLRADGVNNRRTRAVIEAYMASRKSRSFDVLKYRNKIRTIVRHAHAKIGDEAARFLYAFRGEKHFNDPLYDAFLRAHYSKQAVYELPYTVAEGLAARHEIPREEFLRKIEPQMTRSEKLRAQNAAARVSRKPIEVDLANAPLTKLTLYVMSLTMEDRIKRAEELHAALKASALRANRRSPLRLAKVAAVMDRSRSTWSSRERRRRPLAIAVAVHYLLAASAEDVRSFWTPSRTAPQQQYGAEDHVFLMDAGGQTDLATPLLDAIEWKPDQIVIVSDGYENAPADAVNQIVHAYQWKLHANHPIMFTHANPVFDAEHFSPRRLGDSLLTIGLLEAEDLGASIRFARFASGEGSRSELEGFLGELADAFITQPFKGTDDSSISKTDAE